MYNIIHLYNEAKGGILNSFVIRTLPHLRPDIVIYEFFLIYLMLVE